MYDGLRLSDRYMDMENALVAASNRLESPEPMVVDLLETLETLRRRIPVRVGA
jgi:hypothetical protein